MGRGHEPEVRLKRLGDGIHPFGELGWIEDNRRVCKNGEVVGVAWKKQGGGAVGEPSTVK